MEVTFKTSDGRLEVKVDGNMKTVHSELAAFQEVFDNLQCGKCKNPNVRFVVRKSKNDKGKEFDYHELHCQNPTCRARFCYGQTEDGTSLFPKRKDEDGNWKPNNGWTVYNKETGKEE